MDSPVAWLIVFAGIGYGMLCLVMYFRQTRYVYHPERELIADPSEAGMSFQDVFIDTGDGARLHGWYIPAACPKGTVLFFHGNTGNISHVIETLRIIHEADMNCLAIDYRGYGRSTGEADEAGTYRDAEAAYRYLVGDLGIPADRIVLFGRSLGGAVAVYLATRVQPRALVIESSFTSVPDLARRLFPYVPARWLARIRYNSIARMPHITCPVLIIHSREDEFIPFEQAEKLFARARGEKTLLEISGAHNDGFLTSGKRYIEGLQRFLNRCCSVGAS